MISAFDEKVNEGCHQTFDSSLDSLFIFGILIIGYVYSPFEEIPNYAPAVRLVSIPVLVLSGFWMWKGDVIRRLMSKRSA
jgi:hypothetical protein